MENITFDQLRDAVLVFLALCGAIAAVGKAIDVVKGWRRPQSTLQAEVAAYKRRLDQHDQELEDLRDGQRVTCTALKALLGHELHNGNGDEMQAASRALDAWLISK